MLTLTKVDRAFGDEVKVTVLEGLDLAIEQGEYVAIQGPSGCGKSTLLNILGVLDQPDAGCYEIDGAPVDASSDGRAARLRSDYFGFVFQQFHLLDNRPAVDSVETALLYRGIVPVERRSRALNALDAVGLRHQANQLPKTMSGGERQRVAIARAIASEAPVLLADEPTGNLDSVSGARVVEALESAWQQGVTLVIVTHDAEVADRAVRRVQLRDGQLISDTKRPAPRVTQTRTTPPGHASVLHARDLTRDVVKGVTAARGRSVAVAAVVAVAVALVIATIGVAQSAGAQVSSSFDALLNREVAVEAQQPGKPFGGIDDEEMITRADQVVGIDNLGVLTDAGGHQFRAGIVRPTYTARLMAMTGDVIGASRLDIDWATAHGTELQPGETLLGKELATSLEVGPIDHRPVVWIDGLPRTVVGIVASSPRLPDIMGAAIVSRSDLGGDAQAVIVVARTAQGAAEQVARFLPVALYPAQPETSLVHAPPTIATLRGSIEESAKVTLIALSVVVSGAATVSITAVMVLAVNQRRREIGIRRAMGARMRHIAALVAAEATVVGLVGGVFGLVIGMLAIMTVTVGQGWVPVFDFRLAPVAVLLGSIMGVIGGMASVVAARRVQPQQALRD